jgi:hypothetical protein
METPGPVLDKLKNRIKVVLRLNLELGHKLPRRRKRRGGDWQ